MAGPVDIEWSPDALADLERFADFLHEHHPELAGIVAQAIVDRRKRCLRSRDWAVQSLAARNTASSCFRFSTHRTYSNIGSITRAS
jgi:plasmid stabilization system protein ParE